jgi:TonB family protein
MINAVVLALAIQPATPAMTTCNQALAADFGAPATEVCAGEQDAQAATALPKSSPEQMRRFESAVQHYRRAVALARSSELKARVLDELATLYDGQHLDDAVAMERVLQDRITLTPDDPAPSFRLAELHERRGLIDAAEETLLDARRRHAQNADAYKRLAQFYVRRVTAMTTQAQAAAPKPPPASSAAERDDNGVYRVGGVIAPPRRLENPVYPPDALAAGINGVVLAEIVIDEAGAVSDARILRSVPFLDEAALEAVKNWRYRPTLVNGQAVPVRATVTVNFTLR